MDLLYGNKKLLTFDLTVEVYRPFAPDPNSALALHLKVNRDTWRGFEPGSCRVVDIRGVSANPAGPGLEMTHVRCAIVVGYRPAGWISAVEGDGRQRLNGWRHEIRDQRPDGTLLDGQGQPLPPGAEPVYSSFRTAEWGEFGGVDFGELVGEC